MRKAHNSKLKIQNSKLNYSGVVKMYVRST